MATCGAQMVTIPLGGHGNGQTEICVKATVSYPGSKILHVLDDLIEVPKFAQFSQRRDLYHLTLSCLLGHTGIYNYV